MFTYNDMVDYIEDIPKFSKKTTHENIKAILEKMGINENTFKIIHVAGTNGKGSVCAYISGILIADNKKTGTFISPHLVTTRERFLINGTMVSEEEFMEAFNYVLAAIKDLEAEGLVHPSYFEYLFLMGMYIFKKNGVEFAVLETGLGGRLDVTNVFEKVCLSIITSVSMDHMEILGDTLDKICMEKAGIIKENTPVLYLADNEICRNVIEQKAKEKNAQMFPVFSKNTKIIKKSDKYIDFCFKSMYYKEGTFSVPSIALYQVINSMMAAEAAAVIGNITGKPIPYDTVRQGIGNTTWEGRMERIFPDVILDGAHNEDGIAAFIKTCQSLSEHESLSLLFSAVKEKDYIQMVKEICEGVDFNLIVVTNVYGKRNRDAYEIAEVFKKFTDRRVLVIEDPVDAYIEAYKQKDPKDTLMCAGSLYLIGALKEYLRRNIQ